VSKGYASVDLAHGSQARLAAIVVEEGVDSKRAAVATLAKGRGYNLRALFKLRSVGSEHVAGLGIVDSNSAKHAAGIAMKLMGREESRVRGIVGDETTNSKIGVAPHPGLDYECAISAKQALGKRALLAFYHAPPSLEPLPS